MDLPFHLSDHWFGPWRAAYAVGVPTRMVGGVPLLAPSRRQGPAGLRMLVSATNVHSALFDLDDAEDAATLPVLLKRYDAVRLDYLSRDGIAMTAAAGWRDCHVVIEPHAVAPIADCSGGYDAWLRRRGKRVRTRWPRMEREVFDRLGLTFEVVRAPGDLDRLLDALFAVEASGWKGRAGTAIRDSVADTLFYRALAHRAAAAGALRISLLRQGDTIVAFEYGILTGDRLLMLKVGFDERFAEHSIGHVLAARTIRHCCEDPAIRLYDKLGNGMTPAAYKMRLADGLDTLWRVTLYARRPRGQLGYALHKARIAAKRLRDRWRRRGAQA